MRISGVEEMVLWASSRERDRDMGAVALFDIFGLEVRGMIFSLFCCIQTWYVLGHFYILCEIQKLTLLSAISGFSHRGKAFAASINRNSPSVSTTLIHRFEN